MASLPSMQLSRPFNNQTKMVVSLYSFMYANPGNRKIPSDEVRCFGLFRTLLNGYSKQGTRDYELFIISTIKTSNVLICVKIGVG